MKRYGIDVGVRKGIVRVLQFCGFQPVVTKVNDKFFVKTKKMWSDLGDAIAVSLPLIVQVMKSSYKPNSHCKIAKLSIVHQ